MTASSHSDLPSGQGNAHADDVTGSGQKTAAGHTESGHGETGIDPRIEAGLSANESSTQRPVAVRRPPTLAKRPLTDREQP